jgi:ribosome maturation factor RimP
MLPPWKRSSGLPIAHFFIFGAHDGEGAACGARGGGMQEDILTRIESVVTRIVEFAGMELIHIELRREGAGLILRLFIDKEGGVGLEDCAQVSRQVSAQLDVDDPIRGRYTLEVSSPGPNRPLSRDRDFERFAGHRVWVTTHAPMDGQRNFVGRLQTAEEGAIQVALDDGRVVTIARDRIARARLHEEPETVGAKRGARGRHA